jgi:AcrR family transcriptional regulator
MIIKKQKMQKLSSEDRKAQILSAARTLFAKKGYAEATLDDIAEKVGVSRPRIIQLFGSKQNIYETIAEGAYKAHPMDKDLAEPMERKDDFAVLEAFARHILGHTVNREEREIFKILMYARLKEDRFHRVHFHKKDTLMINRLSDYVSARVKDGAFKKVDPRTIIFCYQAMISNLAIYKNVMKQMEFISIEELSSECAQIFLDGIRAKAPQPVEKPKPKRTVIRKPTLTVQEIPKITKSRTRVK